MWKALALTAALTATLGASCLPAAFAASGAQIYANQRYGYSLEIPPNFTLAAESDSGDGATFRSKEDKAEILVFATTFGDGTFEDEIRGRAQGEKDDGWTLTYEKIGRKAASYSGTRKGMILYARAMPLCAGSAVIFRMEYPQSKRKAFDAKVEEMVKALKPGGGC